MTRTPGEQARAAATQRQTLMAAETSRQQALLQAIARGTPPAGLALREHDERAVRGLAAYRVHAEASADRALAAAFGTVQAMVGHEPFAHLARDFWRAHPPLRGDLGDWGEAFPAWLAAQAAMTRWPWLADSARLDLARHRNERAADAVLAAGSLVLLSTTEPSRLRLVWMPGTALLRSAWPIVRIHQAHTLAGDAAEQAFSALRTAMETPCGENALVVREGWRAAVHPLDATHAQWTQDLLEGRDLDTALTHAGPGFDFSTWLATALHGAWLAGVVVLP